MNFSQFLATLCFWCRRDGTSSTTNNPSSPYSPVEHAAVVIRASGANFGNDAKIDPQSVPFLAMMMHYSVASYCPTVNRELKKEFSCELNINRLPGVKELEPLANENGIVNRCADDVRYGRDDVSRFQLIANNDDEETQSAFYMGVNPAQKRIVVAFRGTQSIREVFKTDVDVPFIDAAKINPMFGGEAKIHRGFANHYLKNAQAVQGNLTMLAKKYPDYPITITGHSLGGAVALFAGMDFALSPNSKEYKNRLGVVTFGEPRTGNNNWAKFATSQLMDRHYRVQHRGDFVPHLPTPADQYFHAGPQIRLSGKFLDNRNNFTVGNFSVEICDTNPDGTGESPSCQSDLDEAKIHNLVKDAVGNLDGFDTLSFLKNLPTFRQDLRNASGPLADGFFNHITNYFGYFTYPHLPLLTGDC